MCSGVTAYGALKRLVDRPRQRNLLLIGLGGVGMWDGAFVGASDVQRNGTVVDVSPAARAAALANGADVAYDPAEGDIVKRIVKETAGDGIVDFCWQRHPWPSRSRRWRAAAIVVSGLIGVLHAADGAMGLQADDHRGFHGGDPGRGA